MRIQWTTHITGSAQSHGIGRVMIDDEVHTLKFHSAAGNWQITVLDSTGATRWFWKGTNDNEWSLTDPDASTLCETLLEIARSKWTTPDDYRSPIHISTPIRIQYAQSAVEPEPRVAELPEGGPDWILKMNHHQLRLLAEALEFYERVLGLGQFEEIGWALSMQRPGPYDASLRNDIEHLLVLLKKRAFNLDRNQSFGIYSKEVAEKFRVSYDMFKVIRKRLAETQIARLRMNGHTKDAERVSMTVWNDEVFASSTTEPLITVTKDL